MKDLSGVEWLLGCLAKSAYVLCKLVRSTKWNCNLKYNYVQKIKSIREELKVKSQRINLLRHIVIIKRL